MALKTQQHESEWDYIVVGGGAAGCALADRLSEPMDNEVLLIEAGGSDIHPYIQMPWGLFKLPDRMDWGYEGEPDTSLDGRVDRWAAGKVLGGGSSVNGMIWVRGSHRDYDEWEKLGARGWSYSDVLPYFRRSESFELGEDKYRGCDGPQHVALTHVNHVLNDAFLLAAEQGGHDYNTDYNGASQLGAGRTQVSQRHGVRWSTARGYLARARRRRNFTLMSKTQAMRVVIEDGRAVGVEVIRSGKRTVLRSRKEVILSAGAIATPQLLMLSGVGPADVLRAAGVKTVVTAPEVGRNLQEHPCASIVLDVNVRTLNQEFGPTGFVKHGLDFVARGRGAATSTAAQAMLFGSLGDDPGRTDFQTMFAPFGVVKAKSKGGASDSRKIELAPTPMARALVCVVHPYARGTITLRSADATDRPRIERPLWGDPRDVAQMAEAMRETRSVLRRPTFAKYVKAELLPGTDRVSDDDVMAAVLPTSYAGQHASGTCRMGEDDQAVVDPSLRVRGVESLRVADASVMPTVISGNTNAPSIMIGERAADLVLADR